MPKGDRLTPKQRAWADEYAKTGNASQAALKAGYGHRQRGQENVAKSVMDQYWKELGVSLQDAEKLTVEHVKAGLLKEATEAENDGTRVRAWEVIGRALGAFVSSVEITDKTQDIEGMLSVLEAEKPQLAAVLRQELGLTQELKH